MSSLRAIVFDSLETCLALEPMRERLVMLGFQKPDLELWFSAAQRDAFACEASGDFRPFADVAASALRVLAVRRGLSPTDLQLTSVVAQLAQLPPYADLPAALQRVHAAGLKVGVLSNGGVAATRAAFERAGLAALVDVFASAEEVHHFKPAARPYHHVAKQLGLRPSRVGFISAHGWDVQGAASAGLRAAYVSRYEPMSEAMHASELSGSSLLEALEALKVRRRTRRAGKAAAAIAATAAALGVFAWWRHAA